ncbi:MAG: antirestriction protein ArdA [Candidatus Nomurabacteria bacterium]|jgi:antirestriction protein|nr:antirestriction protein ArdA [Candidatus Nomurabacteria bacterium]
MSAEDDTKHIDKQNNTNEEQEKRVIPSIYVASLSDYVGGRLHGCWIRADQEDEKIFEAIRQMLKQSPNPLEAEGYAIHDYEGFGSLKLDEYDDIKQVAAAARNITEYGEPFAVWASLMGLTDASSENAYEKFSECYQGEYESPESYAEEMLDSCGMDIMIYKDIPDNLRCYIKVDYEAFVRDLECENTEFYDNDDGKVFVFCW